MIPNKDENNKAHIKIGPMRVAYNKKKGIKLFFHGPNILKLIRARPQELTLSLRRGFSFEALESIGTEIERGKENTCSIQVRLIAIKDEPNNVANKEGE